MDFNDKYPKTYYLLCQINVTYLLTGTILKVIPVKIGQVDKLSITLIIFAVMDKLSISLTVSKSERGDNMVCNLISIIV